MVLMEKKQDFKCKTRVFSPNNRLFASCLPIIFFYFVNLKMPFLGRKLVKNHNVMGTVTLVAEMG